MKEPKKLDIDNGNPYQKSLSASHPDDEMKCHIMVMSWGELSSMSLNKTQVKRLINWLNRWVKFKDKVATSEDNTQEEK